jgi:hypothetical protein
MPQRKAKITKFSGNVQRLRAPKGYKLRFKESIGRDNSRRDVLFTIVKDKRRKR